MSDDQEFRPVRSADRTLDMLELLATQRDGASFAQIAAQLHLPKSSLSGLLRTLVARNYVARTTDGRRFRLGARLLELSAGYAFDQGALAAAEAALSPLAQRTGAPAALAVLDGT